MRISVSTFLGIFCVTALASPFILPPQLVRLRSEKTYILTGT